MSMNDTLSINNDKTRTDVSLPNNFCKYMCHSTSSVTFFSLIGNSRTFSSEDVEDDKELGKLTSHLLIPFGQTENRPWRLNS